MTAYKLNIVRSLFKMREIRLGSLKQLSNDLNPEVSLTLKSVLLCVTLTCLSLNLLPGLFPASILLPVLRPPLQVMGSWLFLCKHLCPQSLELWCDNGVMGSTADP